MARDRILRKLTRERFLVTLKSGEAFDGLLLAFDDRTFELADVWAVTATSRTLADGTVYLSRADVAYLQRLGG